MEISNRMTGLKKVVASKYAIMTVLLIQSCLFYTCKCALGLPTEAQVPAPFWAPSD